MQKQRKNKIDLYRGYKITLISLVAIYIIFVAIMSLVVEVDNRLFVTIAIIVGFGIILVALLFGLIMDARRSDMNSIRILELDFDRVDVGMKKLLDMMPTVFIHGNYINTYVYNMHDRCYYEIYTKDEIKWMRNIGRRNPREKYYYGL